MEFRFSFSFCFVLFSAGSAPETGRINQVHHHSPILGQFVGFCSSRENCCGRQFISGARSNIIRRNEQPAGLSCSSTLTCCGRCCGSVAGGDHPSSAGRCFSFSAPVTSGTAKEEEQQHRQRRRWGAALGAAAANRPARRGGGVRPS